MDRREFFKLAGTGAGALLSAPEMELYELLNKPVEEPKPKTTTRKTIHYETGFIYRGEEQIAAIANCIIDAWAEPINITTIDNMPWEYYIPGPMHITISGDLIILNDDMHAMDLIDIEELLHIVVAMPDGNSSVEADGMITNISSISHIDHPLVNYFEFHISGEATITESNTN